jgi:pimeloyl-ACP methyl ester carboxylesterase
MMRRIGVGRIWPLAAGLAVLAAALASPAQAPPGGAPKAVPPSTSVTPTNADLGRVRVPLTTADGVELDGTYYRSPKSGRDAPCVILVHKFGADRSKSDWVLLATELQSAGFAVLTFDLRGHGGSTQLSNPQLFWSLPFNRNHIIGGTANTKKIAITSADFKPSYLPFMVNDLAAARRFFELKNDAGEVNVHSLIIVGAQEGADLGFLFTAAEYARTYTIGVTALQSNGTPYNAGLDIAAGVWLSLVSRPAMPSGAPSFSLASWVRTAPASRAAIRDKTPMCFIYGDKESHAKADSEAVFQALTTKMSGRPDKHKLDELHPIRGTDLSGAALLGQPDVATYVGNYCKKVLTDRRAIPWTEVKPEVNFLQIVPVGAFGFK